jgi:hypothetical protein
MLFKKPGQKRIFARAAAIAAAVAEEAARRREMSTAPAKRWLRCPQRLTRKALRNAKASGRTSATIFVLELSKVLQIGGSKEQSGKDGQGKLTSTKNRETNGEKQANFHNVSHPQEQIFSTSFLEPASQQDLLWVLEEDICGSLFIGFADLLVASARKKKDCPLLDCGF